MRQYISYSQTLKETNDSVKREVFYNFLIGYEVSIKALKLNLQLQLCWKYLPRKYYLCLEVG
jgi:hypothetical protein